MTKKNGWMPISERTCQPTATQCPLCLNNFRDCPEFGLSAPSAEDAERAEAFLRGVSVREGDDRAEYRPRAE